jgi:hypothetical protein
MKEDWAERTARSFEAKHQTVFIITVYSNEKNTGHINEWIEEWKENIRGSSFYTQAKMKWNNKDEKS